MDNRNPYDILQVSPLAEIEVIEAAYKRLAFKYHPDRYFGADANEKMKNINWSYSILRDPIQRERYDQYNKVKNNPMQEYYYPKVNENTIDYAGKCN